MDEKKMLEHILKCKQDTLELYDGLILVTKRQRWFTILHVVWLGVWLAFILGFLLR